MSVFSDLVNVDGSSVFHSSLLFHLPLVWDKVGSRFGLVGTKHAVCLDVLFVHYDSISFHEVSHLSLFGLVESPIDQGLL